MNSPGITIRPLYGMGAFRTNEVFYDNVKVPKQNRVGEENRGWYYIGEALNFERTYVIGGLRYTFDQIVEYAKETQRNGKSLGKDPIIRAKLAELAVELEVAYLLAARIAWMLARGIVPNYEAAMVKLYASELEQRIVDMGMQILGLYGQLQQESKWAALKGRILQQYLQTARISITRGSSEVMRTIIALRGLGLPR